VCGFCIGEHQPQRRNNENGVKNIGKKSIEKRRKNFENEV